MDGLNKRVACLYRVSTLSQVDKETNDIPMQQNACANFVKAMPNWSIDKEYIERGVSGYKKTAVERDVLQQVKKDAENKLFDVLLVFMFDRLGRREDETPFILEWFVEQGIEVWSVKEGQQRFENRTDKLLNYIRFWQSGGESEKTGIRVKEKHTQMIKEGQFCGGIAPYGYQLVKSGYENNKGRQLKKMVINEEESEVVKQVYKLATENGYGGHRIALHLNELGIPTRKNCKWGLTVVNYMLRNPIYKGYPAYGKTTAKSGSNKRLNPADWYVSEVKVDELAIIEEDVWEKAQVIRNARTPKMFKPENMNYSNYPQQTKSPLLLIGLVKCGHCGSTLCTYTQVAKWKTKEGEKRVVRPSYRCTSVNRGIKCDGQITYVQNKIEEPVLDEVLMYLDNLEKVNLDKTISEIRKQTVAKEEKELAAVQKALKKIDDEIKKLNGEIVKAISGDSYFSPEQLSNAIRQQESGRNELFAKEESLNLLLAEKMKDVNKFVSLQGMIPNWREEFERASVDVQKMLISELIDEVVVYRDRIEVNFKISFEEFV